MQKVTLITGNKGKVDYFEKFCDFDFDNQKLDIEEIQTLSVSDAGIAKAKSAYQILQKPVLVDDSSLAFLALGKLPGPFIKWFFETLGAEGLCRLVDQYENREALCEVALVYYDGTEPIVFLGARKGRIAKTPKGENNFGWDAIFIPTGEKKTWAEMTPEEKNQTSPRAEALLKLKKFLHPDGNV